MRTLRILVLALAAAAALPAQAHYERGELERLLAPIALYPDSVLSHVLIAATYPDQVADAARWSRAHPKLEGEAAVDAVERYDWDPSVKALAAFPEVLARMDEDPDWTDEVGEAFLDHEADVMDSVQRLRKQAYDAGRLRELDHVHVVYERDYIYLEPRVHRVVYVPYYDPWWVYGTWAWHAYPPHCWRHWRGHAVSYYAPGWYWGIGFSVRPTFYFTTFYWPERYVVVNHRRDRPLYSGRSAGQQPREVRHWREEPTAARHVSRDNGNWRRHAQQPAPRAADRREGRRDDRREDRRDNREGAERRENRNAERADPPRQERREESQERRETRANIREERSVEQRRERMEEGRQRRDAERSSQRNEPRTERRSEQRNERRTEPRGEQRRESRAEPQERPERVERTAPRAQPQGPEAREERQERTAEPPPAREERAREPRESRGNAEREERGRGQPREQRPRERRERER